jgi:U-box domain
MAERKQDINMTDGLDVIDGVGEKSMEVLLRANFKTIEDLKKETVGYGQRIQDAVDELKREKPHLKASYWNSLALRCCKIIERIQTAEASPFIPSPYMCPLTKDWMVDPVVAPSGYSYERSAIEEWLEDDCRDPFTREEFKIDQLIQNRHLKHAIKHYRRNHLRFSVAYDV